MIAAFLSYLNKLVPGKNRTFLLAVSGGLDSMVMLHLFERSKLRFAVAHCNFSLRGEESDSDEDFVRKAAKEAGAPIYSVRFRTTDEAARRKKGIQETARELRYEWLEKIRSEQGYDHIATAHHAGDSVETILMNLCRGTGIAGLHGIPAVNGRIVRPLLFTGREQLQSYANENKVKWREDSSNKGSDYTRNRVRLELIPLMESIWPGAKNNILLTSEILAETEKIYREALQKHFASFAGRKGNVMVISCIALERINGWKAALYEFLSGYGFNRYQVADIAEHIHGPAGKQFHSGSHTLCIDRGKMLLTEKETRPSGDSHYLEPGTKKFTEPPLRLVIRQKKRGSLAALLKPACAVLDRNKLDFPLELRRWRPGDHFYPTGMKGKKKVSDLLTDQKVPLKEKQDIFVLLSGGEIAWVVGMRADRRFAAGEQSREYYIVEKR